MSIIKEFKQFAIQGSAMDMAIGIIIGGAFGETISSLVNDIIMPPIGVIVGGVDFSDLQLNLKAASGKFPAVTLNYGLFLNKIINFSIVASSMFFMVKLMNSLKKSKKQEIPTTKKCPECKFDIPISAKRCGHCSSKIA